MLAIHLQQFLAPIKVNFQLSGIIYCSIQNCINVPCPMQCYRNRKFTLVLVSLLLLSSVCFVKGYRNRFFRSKYIDDRDFH